MFKFKIFDINNTICTFRYAVTVWYLDEKEKQEYLKRSLEEYEMGNIGAQQLIEKQPCDKVNVIQGTI